MDPISVAALVFAALSAIASLYLLKSRKRKVDADVDDTRTTTALRLLKPLEDRVARLEVLVEKQAEEIRALRRWGNANEELVRINGGRPVPLKEYLR